MVREIAEVPSNWRQQASLPDYLRQHNIVGISDIDTRALVRHIRTHGAMRCMISTRDLDPASLVQQDAAINLKWWDRIWSRKSPASRDTRWQDPSFDLFPPESESAEGVRIS